MSVCRDLKRATIWNLPFQIAAQQKVRRDLECAAIWNQLLFQIAAQWKCAAIWNAPRFGTTPVNISYFFFLSDYMKTPYTKKHCISGNLTLSTGFS